ncbi:hypothetical protein ACFL6U_00220 [Planctomycetota bacterium]
MPPRKSADAEEISMKNTKKELLEAYQQVLAQIEEKEKSQLNPQQTLKQKKEGEVVAMVARLSAEGVVGEIDHLKADMIKLLANVADKLAREVERFEKTQLAIEIKERELKEIYEIDKAAATLAALIESQQQERQRFAEEMASDRETLACEIKETRLQWERKKAEYEAQAKEQAQEETKQRKRKEEEYQYAFDREKQLARNKFEDEQACLLAGKEALEKEMVMLREQTEKGLQEREQRIAEKENQFTALQVQVDEFPKKLELAIAQAVKDATERLELQAQYRQDLQQKEYQGEKNVLTTRIQSLEKTVQEQNEQLAKLSQHQEAAYQKVQDVAVKAIEGASRVGAFSELQQTLAEQTKRQNKATEG